MKNYMPATSNLEEIDQFLEIYNKAKMKKEEIRNLNTQITGREIESAIKNLPTGDAYINRVEWNKETKRWFFKIIKKMDQALASLINKKTEKT